MSKSSTVALNKKTPVSSHCYAVERDGGGFTLYLIKLEDEKLVSKTVIHHQDSLFHVLNKLQQAVVNDHQ